MLSNWFMSFLGGLITSLSGVISAVSTVLSGLSSATSGLAGGLMGYLAFLTPVVDPGLLFFAVTTLLTLLIAAFLFRIANWLFNKIPIIAGFGFGG